MPKIWRWPLATFRISFSKTEKAPINTLRDTTLQFKRPQRDVTDEGQEEKTCNFQLLVNCLIRLRFARLKITLTVSL